MATDDRRPTARAFLRRPWSDRERDLLRQLWPAYLRGDCSRADVMACLPARTWDGIAMRAYKMGLRGAPGEPDEAAVARLRARGVVI